MPNPADTTSPEVVRQAGCTEPNPRADLSVIVVSFNDARWLERCLSSVLNRAGDIDIEIALVDNGSDGAGQFVRSRFPSVRVLEVENRGFAHANNCAAVNAAGRYVLFLNPDTAIVAGHLSELVRKLDNRPEVGVAGVRQVSPDGVLWPTIRYFPGFTRALGDALGAERWKRRPRWAGERELDLACYERETDCDWTSGSFMCVRREALLSAGLLDERFFLYSEEPDLCRRVKQAGWSVRHVPLITIIHHAGKAGMPPRAVAQDAFTRRQYARKHFRAGYGTAYLAAVGARHVIRAVVPAGPPTSERKLGARLALRTLVARGDPPFAQPPPTALPADPTPEHD